MAADPILDQSSAVAELARRGVRAGWRLSLCEAAREAGGSFQSVVQTVRVGNASGPAGDPVPAAEERLGVPARRPVGIAQAID